MRKFASMDIIWNTHTNAPSKYSEVLIEITRDFLPTTNIRNINGIAKFLNRHNISLILHGEFNIQLCGDNLTSLTCPGVGMHKPEYGKELPS
jgi:hypothetical protein